MKIFVLFLSLSLVTSAFSQTDDDETTEGPDTAKCETEKESGTKTCTSKIGDETTVIYYSGDDKFLKEVGYDANGVIISSTVANPDGSFVITSQPDAEGKLTRTVTTNKDGNPVSDITLGNGKDITITYDYEKDEVVTTEKFTDGSSDVLTTSLKDPTKVLSHVKIDKDGVVAEQEDIKQTENDCDKSLKEELKKILEKDTTGVVALQFKLTMLKLAKKTLANKDKTLEAYIKKDGNRLEALKKENPEPLNDVKKAWANNQGAEILKTIEELPKKWEAADYWSAQRRLNNYDVSSYLLYEYLHDKDSEMTESDIAVTWYMQKLSEEMTRAEKGDTAKIKNLTNLSNQLARYSGVIAGTSAASAEELDEEMKAAEAGIAGFMEAARKALQANMAQCYAEGKWQGTCNIDDDKVMNQSLADLLLSVKELAEHDKTVVEKVIGQTRQDNAKVIPPVKRRPAYVPKIGPKKVIRPSAKRPSSMKKPMKRLPQIIRTIRNP